MTLPAMHAFMMMNENVILEVTNFLLTVRLGSDSASQCNCDSRQLLMIWYSRVSSINKYFERRGL